MKRPIRPPQGWPWEQPGFLFYSAEMKAWLGGYTPTCADKQRTPYQSLRRDGPNVKLGGTDGMRGTALEWMEPTRIK